MQAFCVVMTSAHSDDAYRANVMEMHATFSRSLSRINEAQVSQKTLGCRIVVPFPLL